MKNISLLGLLLASTLATGCAFENKRSSSARHRRPERDGAAGGTSTDRRHRPAGIPRARPTPASAFAGAWGSSTIAGLPLGNCSDVKWLITAQTASSVSGTVTANCASGVSVAANLTGTMQSENVINLVATGTMTAMGLPCQFNLNGTGTRQAGDTMKVDYNGSYCFGTVSGTETLRKFPNI